MVLTPNGGAIVVFGYTYAEIARMARKIAFQRAGRIDWGDCPPTAGIGTPRCARHSERLDELCGQGGDPNSREWV